MLRHDGEGVQLASFGDLDACAELFTDCIGERSAGIAAVSQNAGDLAQRAGATIECGQRTVAVRHLRRRDGNRMRQPSRVGPSGPGSDHLVKYEYTVRHFGNPSGSMRHWQPLLSRYNAAQNTSYNSTVRGLVRRRTPSSKGRTRSNCSRLTSLPYTFRPIQTVSSQPRPLASN